MSYLRKNHARSVRFLLTNTGLLNFHGWPSVLNVEKRRASFIHLTNFHSQKAVLWFLAGEQADVFHHPP